MRAQLRAVVIRFDCIAQKCNIEGLATTRQAQDGSPVSAARDDARGMHGAHAVAAAVAHRTRTAATANRAARASNGSARARSRRCCRFIDR